MKIFLGVVLTLSLFGSTTAQEKPAWVDNLEALILKHERKWKIADKHVASVPTFFHEVIKLTSGANRTEIRIDIHRSAEQAKEQFDGEKIAFTNILSKEAARSSIEGLGDDNYMFIGKRKRNVSLFFIQGTVVVNVSAPSIAITKRFVRYITDSVPAG